MECDPHRGCRGTQKPGFQLTHSRGVRLLNPYSRYGIEIFQLTHSRGVRLCCDLQGIAHLTFQLTHSRGVRQGAVLIAQEQKNFNSRTHVECDLAFIRPPSSAFISTHALTWSATAVFSSGSCSCTGISTHALTWSATGSVGAPPTATRDFNSRTHVECDGRRATGAEGGANFNSRTHVECDRLKSIKD